MVWICYVIGLYFMISVEFGGLRLTNRNTACTTGSGIWKSRVLNACFLDNCQTSVFVILTFFDLFVFYLLMWYQIICYEQNIKEYILSEFHWNILDNFGNSDLVCFSKIKLDIVSSLIQYNTLLNSVSLTNQHQNIFLLWTCYVSAKNDLSQ